MPREGPACACGEETGELPERRACIEWVVGDMLLPLLLMLEWLLLDARPLEPVADVEFLPLSGMCGKRRVGTMCEVCVLT